MANENWLTTILGQSGLPQEAPLLQIDPNQAAMLQGGPGAAAGKSSPRSTPKTQKWRTAVRGQEKFASEAHEAAKSLVNGEPLDLYQRKIINTTVGKWLLGKVQEGSKPETWERRVLSGLPGAEFKDGKLQNVDEMRAVYANVLRKRIANPVSETQQKMDQITLLDLIKKLGPSYLLQQNQ